MQNSGYFDILPFGIFLIDGNGIIVSANKAASDILSAPPGFFINKAIWDSSMRFADKSGIPITKETHPAFAPRHFFKFLSLFSVAKSLCLFSLLIS